MAEAKGMVPWVPGMRATDEDGTGWRYTAGGVWFPDDGATDKPAPKGSLSADFTDMTTGVVVQWIVRQAQQQQAKEDAKTDPTHPLNIMGALDRANAPETTPSKDGTTEED